MKTKIVKRISILFICVALVCAMACPAFASGVNDVFSFETSFRHTELDDTIPRAPGYDCFKLDLSGSIEFGFGDKVTVKFGSFSWTTSVYSLRDCVHLGDTMYYVGNPDIFHDCPDVELASDTDLPFALVVSENYSDPNGYFGDESTEFCGLFFVSEDICSAVFRSISSDEYADLACSPYPRSTGSEDMTAKTVMNETKSVFSGAIGMVAKIAEVFTSYPILYLPIVIGLCAIGIVFFKRMKQ